MGVIKFDCFYLYEERFPLLYLLLRFNIFYAFQSNLFRLLSFLPVCFKMLTFGDVFERGEDLDGRVVVFLDCLHLREGHKSIFFS